MFDHTTQQVSAVARTSDHLDLFVVGFDNAIRSMWWEAADERPDFVSRNDPTDVNFVSTGCATLFINYLVSQLGFSLPQVVKRHPVRDPILAKH